MTLPLPITVAATGIEGLVWLAVIFIWLVFQGLANAAKKKLPPPPDDDGPTPPRAYPQHPEQTPRDELREMIESLTGQKPPLYEPENEAEEALAPRRPAPRPAPARKPVAAPARFAQPARKMDRPVQSAAATSLPRAAKPPPMPVPESAPLPAAYAPPVFAPVTPSHEALRLAPLMKMTWPRSQFQRFAMAARRTTAPSALKRHLTGRAALRQAMISRIVLGPPGGR